MRVRIADSGDAVAIEALYRSLVVGDRNIHVEDARIVELRHNPTNRLFVLEADGEIGGTAFLTICLDAMYGFQPYGVIENIIVLPSLRRAGAGRALMDSVELEARAARCTKLMLLSTISRVEAHAFFRRLGFDGERKRGFVKYLNRPPSLG